MYRVMSIIVVGMGLLAACDLDSPTKAPDPAAATGGTGAAAQDPEPHEVTLSEEIELPTDWEFHFLEPLAPGGGDPAAFDSSLTDHLVVEICADGEECTARRTLDADGQGSERLRLAEDDAAYVVNWHGLEPETDYRVRVLAGGLEIGNLETRTAPRGKGRAGVEDDMLPPGSMPIKFRVDDHPIIRALVMTEAGASATEIAESLQEEFDLAPLPAAELLEQAEHSPSELGHALAGVFGLSDEETAILLEGVGYGAKEVGLALADVFGLSEEDVALLLETAEFPVPEIAEAIVAVFELGEEAVAAVLSEIGVEPEEIAEGLLEAFDLGNEVIAEILRTVGHDASEVAQALHEVFSLGADELTSVLNEVGFAVEDVGNAIVTVLSADPAEVAHLLRDAGHAADEVAGALEEAFELTGAAVGTVLGTVGYSAETIAEVMTDRYTVPVHQLTNLLTITLGFGQSTVEEALIAVGFSASAIKNAVTDFFDDVGDAFCDFFGC